MTHLTKNLSVRALAAIATMFVVAVTLMADPANAAVSRVQGGSASSQASCLPSRQVYVKSWVYKDRGTIQTVANKVELYNNNARMWYYGDRIQEITLQTSLYVGISGTPGIFERTISVPPGSHYVRVWYGWFTTQGYQWLSEDLGWCNF